MDRRPSVLSSINLSGSGESIWCLMRPRAARTQEFVLRWRSEADPGFREIVRQQWNFSPPQTTREIEDYQVDLASVKVLELVIVPDIGGGNTSASLENLQLT